MEALKTLELYKQSAAIKMSGSIYSGSGKMIKKKTPGFSMNRVGKGVVVGAAPTLLGAYALANG